MVIQMGSSSKAKVDCDLGLIDYVFSWTLEDIYNEELYKHKVEKIPESFESVEHYLDSFIFPLIEETRAKLQASMEAISIAPYAKVISLEESEPYGSLHDLKVNSWRNRSGKGGKESYIPKLGDIFVLTKELPGISSDLQIFGRTWNFASVNKVADNDHMINAKSADDNDIPTKFEVRTSEAIEMKEGTHNSFFIVFMTNITTNSRIWNALHKFGNLNVLKEVLSTNSVVCDRCSSSQTKTNGAQELGVVPLSSTLNDSQVAAINYCISTMQCKHRSAIKLIWGPPGTGKTKTLSTLLYCLLKMNCRTLACAPTNVAIKEVASRMLKMVKESEAMDQVKSNSAVSSLGQLVLFGNNGSLKVDGDLEHIFLDYRVDRLAECFEPLIGWRDCFKSMKDFLEDCVLRSYQIFLKNESSKGNHELGEESDRSSMDSGISLVEFTRKRYSDIASPLKRCINTLCTDLPFHLLGKNNFQRLVSLLGLLKTYESIVDETLLVEIFSCGKVHLPSNFETQGCEAKKWCRSSAPLCKERNKCLSILRSLYSSLDYLNKLNFNDKRFARKYCFQNASIIFCTASSSYVLHKVAMRPLDLVVIDEAAQLKECESAIPLQLSGVRHVFLNGDECQLPAMVSSKLSSEAGFGRSLFERISLGHPKHLLNMQHRMHPKISCFPNAKFYHRKILDASNVQSPSYTMKYLRGPMFGPYSFISISDGKEEVDDVGYGFKNMVEVAVVMKIVRELYKECRGSRKELSIGIISPYAAQVVEIHENIGQKYYEKLENFSVKVSSIDGFQGGEEDIIIISTVRSNRSGLIGFLSNPQRTNVALTRAKHCLWILGNGKTLANSQSVWADLVKDAKYRKCYFRADEDKDLAKPILNIKKKLDQMDDFLKGDSWLFNNAEWNVLFSDNFRKSFGNLSKSIQKWVIHLLLKLSSGWRPKKRNVDSISGNSSQLVKQFKVRGFYVICTVDIVMEQSTYAQVLKIWDVLSLEDIPKLIRRLDNIFALYTEDFVNRCKVKHIEGNLEVPMSWERSIDIVRYKDRIDQAGSSTSTDILDERKCVENSKVSESLLLMKFYSFSAGVAHHLLSRQDGSELDLPFKVTDEEQEIIIFPRSTFIIGRSGTGKTTVLTMKLIQKEQQHYFSTKGLYEVRNNSTSSPKKNETNVENKASILRQMFVTVSPKLCVAVKNHISCLKSYASGGKISAENNSIDMHDISDTIEFRDIPDCLADISPDTYPLVITFQKFLMMLDGTIGNSFFNRFHEVRKLCQGKSGISRSIALHAFIRRKEVTYDRFNLSYWPHFNRQLTKMLDSSTIFTEIISHIKGGLKAGEADNGKLRREEYVSLSLGRSSLSGKRRAITYDIFLDYEKMKRQKGDFDLADFVIDLHSRLRHEKYDGDQVDFVYIDEVQDLTMRQLALFKYVCRNFNEGFVFSGDTAQTIARGIDFRFEDIRSLFYKEFLLECRNNLSDKMKDKDQPGMSKLFHLRQNFRTHVGILKLSQSVIELLYHYFPLSIDILSPETSRIYGEEPVLLESGSDENAIVTLFCKSGNSINNGGMNIGFGAEQVILVRDDCARKEIADYVGKKALVLTIQECKGLEFQDVLLYNFFGTSPMRNQWRVIYEYMKEHGLLESSSPCPHFDKVKHNILCSELKQLYVAITRTRQRLWICENVEDMSGPMFDYWKKLCLVQVRKLDDSLAQKMQAGSSKEEWCSCGMKLFNEGQYDLATMCFERANDLYKEKWARAASRRAFADRMRDSKSELAHVALVEAAEIYESIGKAELAAKCFIEAQEFERAGRVYFENCGESRLEDAGDCFKLAGCWSLGAEAYARGNHYSKCLSACTKGKLFHVGLHFINCWKGKADQFESSKNQHQVEAMGQDFLERGALHYHKLKDSKAMMEFVRAFQSVDSVCAFLKCRGYLDELILLEEESGNFIEASNIARLKGDILLEADMLGKGGNFEDATRLIMLYVLSNSLWPLKQFENKDELLKKVNMFAKNVKSDCFYESVSLEVTILSNQESSLPNMCKYLNDSQRLENPRAEIMAAWKILDIHLQSNPAKYEWEHEVVMNPMNHATDMISQNNVSIESLIYFWELWREKIVNMIKYLQSLGTQNETESVSHGETYLDFLGVRRNVNDLSTTYVLLNTDAYWKKEINDRSLQKHGSLVALDVHLFVSAAQSYWFSEMLLVGIKVLETLESLLDFSSKNSLSIFCKGICILRIFHVTRCIMESKIELEKNFKESLQKLEKFLALSRDLFFGTVFPLDWRKTMMESMVALRGTDHYKDLLKLVSVENVSHKGLTHGKIGRVVMLFFVSGKFIADELYELIAKFFKNDESPPWKIFIELLKEHMISGSSEQGSLAFKLQEALQDTFNANWQVEIDYISPHCYIYLVERLLFLVSSCQGSFFTTKSSIAESLAWDNWIKNSTTPSVAANLFKCHDFIACIVDQLLLFHSIGTREWIAKSGIDVKQYWPLLVLRLVVLISLIFLNSGHHLELLSALLGRDDIRSNLPQAFYEILYRRRNHDLEYVIAEAFQTIEDPLVMVYSGNDHPGFFSPQAIVLDRNIISNREDIIQVLFQKNHGVQAHVVDVIDQEMCNDALPHSPLTGNNGDQNLKKQNEVEGLDL